MPDDLTRVRGSRDAEGYLARREELRRRLRKKENICSMCDKEIDERDDVIVITQERKKANYYEPELLAVVCVGCWNGGTDERPVNLNELPLLTMVCSKCRFKEVCDEDYADCQFNPQNQNLKNRP